MNNTKKDWTTPKLTKYIREEVNILGKQGLTGENLSNS